MSNGKPNWWLNDLTKLLYFEDFKESDNPVFPLDIFVRDKYQFDDLFQDSQWKFKTLNETFYKFTENSMMYSGSE